MSSRYSKKHYEDVAQLVVEYGRGHLSDSTPEEFANKFADLFAADNPLFNREQFLAACGLEVTNV